MPSADERATAPPLLRRPFVKGDEVTGRADAEATTQATRDGARGIVDPEFAERTVLHALAEGTTAGTDDGAALRHQIVQSTQREFLSNGLLGR